MPIRVLHIIGSLGLGGAQVVIKQIVENANNDEVEHIVCSLRGGHVAVDIPCKVIILPYRNYDPRKLPAVVRLCRELQIDIIHAHLHKPVLGALLASRRHRIPIVVHEHTPLASKGFDYAVYRVLLRLLWRRAAVFVAVSQQIADCLTRLIGIAPNRMTIIRNAVDFARFDPKLTSRQQARQSLDIASDDLVVGFVGRLNMVKGVDLLIEAMPKLLQQSPNYLLLLAGDGSDRATFERQCRRLGVAERVRFLGFRPDVPQVMSAFDIGVMPSREDPCPLVTLEFLRMATPLVCSGVDGLAELVTDNETALITPQNTPEQIANCISRLMNDDALRQRLIEAGSKHTERFLAAEFARTFERLYADVLVP